jgi:D-alanyl-D-alanine carboxypeptidase
MAAGLRMGWFGLFPAVCPRMMFRHVSSIGLAVIAGLLLTVLAAAPARAQIGSERYSSMVIDAATGRVLLSVNADEPRHPASLTKMMTLYMVFEALRDRRISHDQPVPVSAHAASMEPSKLGLVPGMHITVQEAILGIVTKSANDAASALGEMLGGSEDRFALMMTLRARALGMTHTEYHNASGLPDPNQWTTARDLTTLARHLIQDYPTEYRYFSTPGFRFHGRTVMGHDHMLENYPGTDGIKTGYTDASGFNMVTSAVHSNVRLIGVVMGAAHAGERDLHMASLLDQGFEQMDVPNMVLARRASPPNLAGPNLSGPSLSVPSLVQSAQASTLTPAMRPRPARWFVQIGSFQSEAAARQAAIAARHLAGSGDVAVERSSLRGKTMWRAELIDLSDAEARGSCAVLLRHKQPCTPVRADPGQIASR